MNHSLVFVLLFANDSPLAPVTIDAIRSAVSQNITSIRSIDASFHTSSVGRGLRPADPDEVRGPTACEWAEQGKQRFYRHESIRGTDIGPGQYSHDGVRGYHLLYDPKTSRLARVVQSPEINPAYYAHLTPAEFCGLRLPQSQLSLAELLSNPGVELMGIEEVGGTPCWKVDAGSYSMDGNAPRHVMVWLDPSHGFLPRRLLVHEGDHSETRGEGGRKEKCDYETIEFQQLIVDNQSIWFPKEGRVDYPYGHATISVDRVIINSPLSTAQFQFDVPPGTEVFEETSEPGVFSRQYIAGEAATGNASAPNGQASAAIGTAQRLNARERTGLSVASTALLAAGIFLALALVTHLASRRKRS